MIANQYCDAFQHRTKISLINGCGNVLHVSTQRVGRQSVCKRLLLVDVRHAVADETCCCHIKVPYRCPDGPQSGTVATTGVTLKVLSREGEMQTSSVLQFSPVLRLFVWKYPIGWSLKNLASFLGLLAEGPMLPHFPPQEVHSALLITRF
jgi:hypothetical protein